MTTISAASESGSQPGISKTQVLRSSAREFVVAGRGAGPGPHHQSLSASPPSPPYQSGPARYLGTEKFLWRTFLSCTASSDRLWTSWISWILAWVETDLSGIDLSPNFSPLMATANDRCLTPRAYHRFEYNNEADVPEPRGPDKRAIETPNSPGMDQIDDKRSAGWLPDAAQFSEECTSLRHWASRMSSVILPQR